MRIGNRERIVIGVIAALGAIGTLHMVVFRGNATSFDSAKIDYDNLSSQLQSSGGARPWEDIYRFEYQTINYELQFWNTFESSRIDVPREFFEAVDEDAQRQHFWDFVTRLEELRDKPDGTRLTFLDRTPQGWDFQRNLPERITSAGTDVGDLIRRLQDTDALIKELDKESPLLGRTEADYEIQLGVLGLVVNPPANQPRFPNRKSLKENYGQLAAVLYTLNRIQIIKKSLPARELGLANDAEYNKRLLELFRLQDWELQLLTAYKQMTGLLDLIDMARKHGIADISQVRVKDFVLVTYPPEVVGAKAAGAANQPAQPAYDAYADPYADPYAQQVPQNPVAAPAAAGEIVGAALPIELTLRGSNLAITSFLYEVTHGPRFYEVDELEIAGIPGQEGLMGARVLIKCMSHYAKPELTLNVTQVEAKKKDLIRRKADIATKAGARPLAEEEGFDPVAALQALDGAAAPPPAPTPATPEEAPVS